MKREFDLVLTSQISTSAAFLCAIGAHLVVKYAPEPWLFSAYILLCLTIIFMVFPYLCLGIGDNNEEELEERTSVLRSKTSWMS